MLTLITPTRNRPHYLGRLLAYYRELGLPYTIVIADASDPDYLVQNERIIESVRPGLSIEHVTYRAEVGVATRLHKSAEGACTPYSVIAADDDFFVPDTLRRATEFLEAHADYSVVHGPAAKFGLEPGRSVHGPIARVSRYTQRTVEFPTGAERLNDHLSKYSTTWYSVHRTEQLRENVHKAIEFESDIHFMEVFPSALSLVQGKAKALDSLFMVREAQPYRSRVPSALDWVAGPDWTALYERFCDYVAEELAQQDGISPTEAQDAVRRPLWRYVAGFLNQPPPRPRERNSLQRVTRAVPGVRPAWRRLLRLKQGRSGGDMSLSALLSGTSPYSDDFLPIYRATLTPPEAAHLEAASLEPATDG